MSNKSDPKQQQAVALTYNAGLHSVPRIAAKGKGHVAASIIEKAKEHQVPIQEDASLVELLAQLSINDAIPEELYSAVAEVFAFIYHADRLHSKS